MTNFDIGILEKLAMNTAPTMDFKAKASDQLNAASGMNKAISTAKSLPDLSKTKIDTNIQLGSPPASMNKAISTAKSLPDLSNTKIDTKSMSSFKPLPKLKIPKFTL